MILVLDKISNPCQEESNHYQKIFCLISSLQFVSLFEFLFPFFFLLPLDQVGFTDESHVSPSVFILLSSRVFTVDRRVTKVSCTFTSAPFAVASACVSFLPWGLEFFG